MPIISDTKFCIDARTQNFKLIDKEQYYHLTPYGNRIKSQFENYTMGTKDYIFICVAKVASSSINIALNHKVHPEPKFHHMSISNLTNFYPELDLSKYYKFAFVRNPWDRFLSLYNDMYHKRGGKNEIMNYSGLRNLHKTIFWRTNNFKEFCLEFLNSPWTKEPHFKSQFDYLSINGSIEVDFIGRFENLQEDWFQITKNLGFTENCHLVHATKSLVNSGNYRDHYDSQTKKTVEIFYEKDIEEWNYEF
jgi:hypothetical protein